MLLRVFKRGIAISALVVAFAPLAASSGGLKPGSLDPSFGRAGIVTAEPGPPYQFAFDVALQPDGRIVTAGIGENGFTIERYSTDGSLDSSFGSGGIVSTDFGPGPDAASAVAIQQDGKIVAAGSGNYNSGSKFALARYNPDGSLDASFGNGGKVTTSAGLSVSALALQPNGRLVAGGAAPGGGSILVRYTPKGTLDSGFGEDGALVANFLVYDLVLQPDGKIVAAGGTGLNTSEFIVARYEAHGSRDRDFGEGGYAVTQVAEYSEARSVVVQPDRKIVAGGYAYDFGLARYSPDGSLDKTFGDGGTLTTAFSDPGHSYLADLALQPDGKILGAGAEGTGNRSRLALARYDRRGRLDEYFRTKGTVSTPVSGWAYAYAEAVALQPDGKIVLAGEVASPNFVASAPLVARYFGGSLTCTVPEVRRTTLRVARRLIVQRLCKVGPVKKAFSPRVRKGRVVWQRPRAHTKHRAGTKVHLVVSKGKRKRR